MISSLGELLTIGQYLNIIIDFQQYQIVMIWTYHVTDLQISVVQIDDCGKVLLKRTQT